MSSRLRKKRVEWVVEQAYWGGFFSCLDGRVESVLEYGSDSGLYGYNPIREIAWRHGVYDCQEKIKAREEGPRFSATSSGIPAIPGRVWAEAYGTAKLALPKARRTP